MLISYLMAWSLVTTTSFQTLIKHSQSTCSEWNSILENKPTIVQLSPCTHSWHISQSSCPNFRPLFNHEEVVVLWDHAITLLEMRVNYHVQPTNCNDGAAVDSIATQYISLAVATNLIRHLYSQRTFHLAFKLGKSLHPTPPYEYISSTPQPVLFVL